MKKLELIKLKIKNWILKEPSNTLIFMLMFCLLVFKFSIFPIVLSDAGLLIGLSGADLSNTTFAHDVQTNLINQTVNIVTFMNQIGYNMYIEHPFVANISFKLCTFLPTLAEIYLIVILIHFIRIIVIRPIYKKYFIKNGRNRKNR